MAKKELTAEDKMKLQITRLRDAGIKMSFAEEDKYTKKVDDMGVDENLDVPVGYKRCGRCRHIKKWYLFNKNSAAKDKCSGACKECQKQSAKKSYAKVKKKRNYAAYYQENKEKKLALSKEYYRKNKDKINAKHAAYLQTAKGKAVMQKARKKRMAGLLNTGIPYTPQQVWDRDKFNCDEHGNPICYLCGEAMLDRKDCQIDHIVGINIGGLNCFSNVAYVHRTCNLTKTKDCSEVTAEMCEVVEEMTTRYIDEHPEDFE